MRFRAERVLRSRLALTWFVELRQRVVVQDHVGPGDGDAHKQQRDVHGRAGCWRVLASSLAAGRRRRGRGGEPPGAVRAVGRALRPPRPKRHRHARAPAAAPRLRRPGSSRHPGPPPAARAPAGHPRRTHSPPTWNAHNNALLIISRPTDVTRYSFA